MLVVLSEFVQELQKRKKKKERQICGIALAVQMHCLFDVCQRSPCKHNYNIIFRSNLLPSALKLKHRVPAFRMRYQSDPSSR